MATPKHPRDFENMNDEETLHRVYEDKKAAESFQSQFFEKFARYYRLYRSYLRDDEKRENGANLFIPYTFHIIETVTPKIINTVFASRPFVQTIPVGLKAGHSVQERVQKAKRMNTFLDYQLNQKMRFVPLATDVVKSALIYGTAITKQTWRFETKTRRKKRPIYDVFGFLKNEEEVMYEYVASDEPFVENIPIFDFFFDPAGTTIDDCRYCIHRYYEDYSTLKSLAKKKGYKNVDKLEDDYDGTAAPKEFDPLVEIGVSSTTNRRKGVEIWEYWTDEWRVIVANGEVVLKSEMNPYYHMKKPFAKWVDTPVPNEFYGIGEIEPIEHLQHELNTTRNQRIDNVSLILNRMFKVLRGADIDPEELISRPNGIINVDDMNDIQELTFSDVTQSAYREEDVIKSDMDRTLGVYDAARGSSPDRRETATTMSILSQASSDRFQIKTLLLEEGGLYDCFKQIIWLNQQFIDREMAFDILNEDGHLEEHVITPEEIQGDYDLAVVGSAVEPVVNKEVRQNQLIQLYNVIAQDPDINRIEFLRKLFEAFDFKNIDALLTQQPPMEGQIDPMMGQQGMMMGQQATFDNLGL